MYFGVKLIVIKGLLNCIDLSLSLSGSRMGAAGPGVWALAVILLISLISAAAFMLFKFKR